MFLVLAVLALTQGLAAPTTPNDDIFAAKKQFEEFKTKHGRSYKDHEEEKSRFGVFRDNLKLIDERNARELAMGGSAVHGVTKFADYSPAEFKKLNGFKVNKNKVSGSHGPRPGYEPTRYESSAPLKDDMDVGQKYVNWIGKLTTPVKNQQQCGSCWTFGASEQVESDVMRMQGVRLMLSQSQLAQCDRNSFGCNGGDPEAALDHISAVGGLSLDVDYPYGAAVAAGTTGICEPAKISPVATVTNVFNYNGNVSDESTPWVMGVEKAMARYMFAEGPIAIALDASEFSSYTGGVLSQCGNDIDHAVQAVGLNTEANPPFWIVRNSWGGDWGESGYIYLEYGKNTCGLTNEPITCDTAIVDAEHAYGSMAGDL